MNPLCKRLCTMREALDDPEIFGPILSGDTWKPWRAILIAAMGEELTDDERAIFTELTGREREPLQPVEELWSIVGQRGGKTRAMSVLGVYLACLIDYREVQAPGERLKLAVLAAHTKQATKALNYMLGTIQKAPALADMLDGDATADTIRLTTGVDIEVAAANFRTVRGDTLIGALADELALWRSDNSLNPDEEILEAVRPGLATTEGPLCVLSSPYARKGELWKTYQREYGPDGDPAILVLRAASTVMHPTLSQSVIDRAYKRDAAKASAEYGAEFRKDLEAYITLEAVQACMPSGVREIAPAKGITYSAFTDLAGGGADAMTLAIGHKEKDVAILDAVRELRGPSPDAIAEEFAALCKTYRISKVRGDRYGGEWPRERFKKHGITYEVSVKSKSEIYADFLPILNSARCQLLNVPKLEAQLVSLERRTTRGSGRDIIDHPQQKGAHDDVANAVAGVLVNLTGRNSTEDYMRSFAIAYGNAPYPDA